MSPTGPSAHGLPPLIENEPVPTAWRGISLMMAVNLLHIVLVAGAGGACLLAQPQQTAEVVAPGATLEKLWSEGEFTEGGALAGDGSILFSDIGDRIMKFDPTTRKTAVFREPSGRANCLIFDPV